MPEPLPNEPAFIGRLMGILRLLENTPELNEKRVILGAMMNTHPEFKSVLVHALDPYRKYGIQQWTGVTGPSKTQISWYDIVEFLNRCRVVFTGDRRLAALREIQSQMSANDQTLLRRIILKDLRCGVGATLVNSVAPGTIPEFGIMLASPVTEAIVTRWAKTRPKLYGQAKENGDRMVVMVSSDYQVEAYTRNGHRMHNYKQIESSLSMICQQSQIFKNYAGGAVFDGEVIQDDFWGTRSVKKLAGNEALRSVYHAFDLVGLAEWRKNTSKPFSVRNRDLARMSNEPMFKQRDNVEKVATFPLDIYDEVNDPGELLGELDRYRDELIQRKKEGLIIRPDLVYNYKTRSSMFKHKQMDTGDFLIVEVEKGEEGKKYANTAGKIVVELEDGTLCKAGLKCDELSRAILWDRRSEIVGMMAEIQFSERTKNKLGLPKLQFPVFIRVRKDKS
jgi:DNA ligase-1